MLRDSTGTDCVVGNSLLMVTFGAFAAAMVLCLFILAVSWSCTRSVCEVSDAQISSMPCLSQLRKLRIYAGGLYTCACLLACLHSSLSVSGRQA